MLAGRDHVGRALPAFGWRSMLLVTVAASSPFIWNLGVLAPDAGALGPLAAWR